MAQLIVMRALSLNGDGKCCFQLAEERKNWETFFSNTSESLGVSGVRYQ